MGIMTFTSIGRVDSLDQGIMERMPAYQYEVSPDTIYLPAGHVLHLELTGGSLLRCEGKLIDLHQLPNMVERHLYQAIKQDTIYFVSLRTARTASYSTYLSVKNIVLAQRNDRMNELSLQIAGEPYTDDMPSSYRKAIHIRLELGLLEWVPDESGIKLRMIRHSY